MNLKQKSTKQTIDARLQNENKSQVEKNRQTALKLEKIAIFLFLVGLTCAFVPLFTGGFLLGWTVFFGVTSFLGCAICTFLAFNAVWSCPWCMNVILSHPSKTKFCTGCGESLNQDESRSSDAKAEVKHVHQNSLLNPLNILAWEGFICGIILSMHYHRQLPGFELVLVLGPLAPAVFYFYRGVKCSSCNAKLAFIRSGSLVNYCYNCGAGVC